MNMNRPSFCSFLHQHLTTIRVRIYDHPHYWMQPPQPNHLNNLGIANQWQNERPETQGVQPEYGKCNWRHRINSRKTKEIANL